jgi:drug/metabolite transporter superfamily protein YnfA
MACIVACRSQSTLENDMGIGTILLVILVLALVGVLPTWPHSNGWGYGPSGGVGLILVIVLILFVLGKI